MSRPVSYDSACADLALHFLADEPHTAVDVDELAQELQDTVEAWFGYRSADALPSNENVAEQPS